MNEPNASRRGPATDELAAIRQLLAEPPPPAPAVVLAARARLERAARGTGGFRHAPRRPWRLAAAGALAAAVAAGAGAITAQVMAPGGARPAGVLTVHELAYRAAAAATLQPGVRPGQWVFWREMTGGPRCGGDCGAFHVWTTADSQHAAWVYQGKVVSLGQGPFDGQPQPQLSPYGGWTAGVATGKIPVSYADLSLLPRSPQALDRHLGQLNFPHRRGWGPPAAREFIIIDMMLTSYVMPPWLTAELYQALGDIPGVTVDGHAVDVAGRPGVGFISPALLGGGNEEIILNPRTYHLMGDSLLWGPRHRLVNGTAILREALVPGPGVWP